MNGLRCAALSWGTLLLLHHMLPSVMRDMLCQGCYKGTPAQQCRRHLRCNSLRQQGSLYISSHANMRMKGAVLLVWMHMLAGSSLNAVISRGLQLWISKTMAMDAHTPCARFHCNCTAAAQEDAEHKQVCGFLKALTI